MNFIFGLGMLAGFALCGGFVLIIKWNKND